RANGWIHPRLIDLIGLADGDTLHSITDAEYAVTRSLMSPRLESRAARKRFLSELREAIPDWEDCGDPDVGDDAEVVAEIREFCREHGVSSLATDPRAALRHSPQCMPHSGVRLPHAELDSDHAPMRLRVVQAGLDVETNRAPQRRQRVKANSDDDDQALDAVIGIAQRHGFTGNAEDIVQQMDALEAGRRMAFAWSTEHHLRMPLPGTVEGEVAFASAWVFFADALDDLLEAANADDARIDTAVIGHFRRGFFDPENGLVLARLEECLFGVDRSGYTVRFSPAFDGDMLVMLDPVTDPDASAALFTCSEYVRHNDGIVWFAIADAPGFPTDGVEITHPAVDPGSDMPALVALDEAHRRWPELFHSVPDSDAA
ncbi:MAG: hypothetical protein AB7K09_23320, partial [Planctomycetota bacterium]